MNQTLKKVNEEKVLFFDIEDVRRSKELDINSREFELFRKKTRNRETDEYLPNNEVILEYIKKGALKMGYTTIVSIGVGFVKEGQVHIKALEGTEEDIIKQFCTIAQSFDYVCGANIIKFDLPMLSNNGYRYFDVCEVLPDRFVVNGKKPWNIDKVIDLQDIFQGTHYSPSSLDEVCYHFGIPSSKTDIEGSQVSEEYWTNGVERINRYVKQDVFASVNVFKKMRFEEVFDSFIDKNELSNLEGFTEELPLLQKIYTSGKITEDNRKEIQSLITEPTEEDKINIKKILLAHYQQKGDKVVVKKQKEQEINEFIDNL